MLKNMSIDPVLWGSNMWESIHWIAAGYPLKPRAIDKRHYFSFFQNLGNVLPCMKCRQEYNILFREVNPPMESRDALFRWTWEIHSKVSQKIYPSRVGFTLQSAMSKYMTPHRLKISEGPASSDGKVYFKRNSDRCELSCQIPP